MKYSVKSLLFINKSKYLILFKVILILYIKENKQMYSIFWKKTWQNYFFMIIYKSISEGGIINEKIKLMEKLRKLKEDVVKNEGN